VLKAFVNSPRLLLLLLVMMMTKQTVCAEWERVKIHRGQQVERFISWRKRQRRIEAVRQLAGRPAWTTT